MPFLNVKIICEHGNHFYSPLPSICKIGMSHTLPCRAFWICSNWSKIHLELVQLMFDNISNSFLKGFSIKNIVFKKKKRYLCLRNVLVLPYLGPSSLQTRTSLRKSVKGILNCYNLQIIFKSQNKLSITFRFKE